MKDIFMDIGTVNNYPVKTTLSGSEFKKNLIIWDLRYNTLNLLTLYTVFYKNKLIIMM